MNYYKIKLFLIILIIILIDQLSKFYIINILKENKSIKITNFINLDFFSYDSGIAFGLINITYWSIIINLFIVSGFLFLINCGLLNKYYDYVLALIIGGILGNMIDILIWGYIIRFINLNYNNFYYQIFNIADISRSIGVLLVVFGIFTKKKLLLC